jgi:adenylate cyclase
MDTATTSKSSKLFFEIFPPSKTQSKVLQIISDRKIEKYREKNVKNIIIVTFYAVEKNSYIRMVKKYREKNFQVKSFYFERFTHDNIAAIKKHLDEIHSLLLAENCLLISYGYEYTGAVIAALLVMRGEDAEAAINKVRAINGNLIKSADELSFIYDFQTYFLSLNPLEESPPADAIPEQRAAALGDGTVERYTPSKEMDAAERAPRAVEEKIQEKIEPVETGPPRKDQESAQGAIEEEITERVETTEKTEAPERGEVKPDLTAVEEKDLKGEESRGREAPPPAVKETSDEVDRRAGRKGEEQKETELLKSGIFSSIRFKLISIISLIIILSISGMIFVATYYFKKDNLIRVQENNHKISEVTALKVKSDFESIIKNSLFIANTMARGSSVKERAQVSELFREENDFVCAGVAADKGDTITITKHFYNAPLMRENQITGEMIDRATQMHGSVLRRSFKGETVIHNVSQAFKLPIVGISIPLRRDTDRRVSSIVVSYYKLDSVLKAFKTSGITSVFMVNDEGDIIAHPDSSLVVSGGNYINIPIVKMMMKSKIDNGQTRYADERGVYHLGSFKKLGIAGCGVIATVEEDKAFQEVYNIQRRNIYLMIILLTSAVLVVFFFGKTLTTPIIRLVGATKRIKEGQYSVEINPTTKDEIGELTLSFIEMGKGLQEREKIKTAFGKFVNPELAEAILKDEVQLGGERKTVAVLFSDIRSFTEISEKMEPEHIVGMLNAYMRRMVECIDKSGGVVDKFIGDAIMAVWGAPLSRGNDTENAIESALQMREAMIEYNKTRGTANRPKIKFGIGINTGPVLVGQIGTENRMEYTVIGDTVNLASRIETMNKAFGTDILISEDSYKLVKDIYAVEGMRPIRVKGKEKPQQIYAILGRVDDPQRPRSVEELKNRWGIELTGTHDDIDSEDEEVKYEIL